MKVPKFKKGDIARLPGYGLCIVKDGPLPDGSLRSYYKVWSFVHQRPIEVYSESVYPVKAQVRGHEI